jgi:hypothetical protein
MGDHAQTNVRKSQGTNDLFSSLAVAFRRKQFWLEFSTLGLEKADS